MPALKSIGSRTAQPRDGEGTAPKRLVVELNRLSAQELDDMGQIEGLNKTTLVNRAIQVYALVRKAELDGDKILIEDCKTAATQRVRII